MKSLVQDCAIGVQDVGCSFQSLSCSTTCTGVYLEHPYTHSGGWTCEEQSVVVLMQHKQRGSSVCSEQDETEILLV